MEEHIAEIVDCFSKEETFPKLEGDAGFLKEPKDLVDVVFTFL